MNEVDLFTKEKVTKMFFKIAIPGSIGMLSSAIYLFIDGIFVSQILGSQAFASINLIMPFVIVLYSVADLIGVGSSVKISILLGKGKDEEANNVFTCSCLMIFIGGGIVGLTFYLLAPYIVSFMGAEGKTFEMAKDYLQVYSLCAPISIIVFAVDNYLRICKRIKFSMFLNVFMSITIIIFEYCLLKFTPLGVVGSALSICIGFFICSSIAFIPFILKKNKLKFVKPHFHFTLIKEVIRNGSPTFLANIAGRITSIVLNIILLKEGGEDAVACYGVLLFIDGFIQPILYGMCDSLQPCIGFNYGANNKKRVIEIEKRCYLASFVVAFTSFLILITGDSWVFKMFLSGGDNSNIEYLGKTALFCFSFAYLFRWFTFNSQSFMSAIEKSKYSAIISVLNSIVFPMFLILCFYSNGLLGVFLNFTLSNVLTTVFIIILFIFILKNIFNKEDFSFKK